MEQNVATRLKFFLESQGLSNSQFADTCGIPRPTLSQLLTGRNKKISDILVGQIHQSYPQLSIMWLLFGEGPMLDVVKPEEGEYGEREESFAPDTGSGVGSGSYFGEFKGDEASFRNNRRENGVNRVEIKGEYSANQRDNSASRIAELEREIMKLKGKPRKVVQITVYYDDNTFETFVPGA